VEQSAPQQVPQSAQDASWNDQGKKVQSSQEFNTRTLDTQLDKMTRRSAGRRSRTLTDRTRGRYIQARPIHDRPRDIAFDATIRAAAPYQQEREDEKTDRDVAYAIRRSDLHRKVRVKKSANLVMFVVDASWSMAVAERMSATKGAIMSLLTDAYQRRDRVGLIVFQKDRATLVLPPTNSVTLAKKALADIPVGGKTPLAAGLLLAYNVIQQEQARHPDVMPLMILLTDGAGNVSIGDDAPQAEAHAVADIFKQKLIRCITVNMEHAAFDQGLAQRLAEKLGGPCYALSELKAEVLYQTVKKELET
jgi:Mg-chelatase subunit ChlD